MGKNEENIGLVEEKNQMTKELLEKDELISKLKMDLKKRGVLLHGSQTNIENEVINKLNEKINDQTNTLSEKEKEICNLQDNLSNTETEKSKLAEMHARMKID